MAADFIRERSKTRAELDWQEKQATDFVTMVDTGAEERINQIVGKEWPDAYVVGEELSPSVARTDGIAFIADPLDGTTNFLHGYPWYAVSIGIRVDNELVAGVIRNVTLDEEWIALQDAGAYRGDQPLRVSSITRPARALIGTGFPFKHPSLVDTYQQQFVEVMRVTSGIRRAGSAALDLCDVAAGRFEAFWELRLSPWDVAAGILMVREAGGIVTNLRGEHVGAEHTGLVAGNPPMHSWLLPIVRQD